jgi:hypothetical protein
MSSPQRMDNTPYLPTGYPGSSTETNKFRSGEFGHVYIDYQGKRWQNVRANSVLTQAAVASNLLYWASAHGFIVDTDLTDSEAGRNSCAGVLDTAANGVVLPTANQYFWALQEGTSITCNGTTTNFLANMVIIPSATVGLVDGIAAGTAPTYLPIGTVHTAVDRSGGAGTVVCDLSIPSRIA